MVENHTNRNLGSALNLRMHFVFSDSWGVNGAGVHPPGFLRWGLQGGLPGYIRYTRDHPGVICRCLVMPGSAWIYFVGVRAPMDMHVYPGMPACTRVYKHLAFFGRCPGTSGCGGNEPLWPLCVP